MKFKLLQYNIWHGTFFERLLTFLDDVKPDIICFQEMATSGKGFYANEINLYEEVKRQTGYEAVFSHMFDGNVGKGLHNMGVAVFSRFPIRNAQEFLYERDRTDEVLESHVKDRYFLPRVLLDVDIDIEGHVQKIATTHFTITEDASVSEHQLKSVAAVREYLNQYDEFLFCGDMNMPYGNESYQQLSKGLQDFSLPDKPTLHPTIHKVGHMNYHVDYVFYKGNSLKHLFTDVPVVDASDHLPIICEFEVK